MPSFDIVSQVNEVELRNAVDQANKEIGNRFDFKGSDARVEQAEHDLTVFADDEFKLGQAYDVLLAKLAKRSVDLRCLDKGDVEKAGGDKVRQTVTVRTNAPTRPSRLYRGIGTYMRKSMATIFRIYTLYKPLKTFFAIGALLMLAGIAIGARFLWFFLEGERGGHVQSLILAAVFLIVGFQTLLIGLIADLISVNRRLSEEVLIRVKRLESPAVAVAAPAAAERRPRQQQPQSQPARRREEPARPAGAAPAAAAPQKAADTQWVWLVDEDKLAQRIGTDDAAPAATPAPPPAPQQQQQAAAPSESGGRRRRRRRGGAGVRQHAELPGNRGKHLTEGE